MSKVNVEKIERYLSGEMSNNERLAFETELKMDQSLQDLYRIYLTIESEMKAQEKKHLEEEAFKFGLERLNKKYFSAPDETAGENQENISLRKSNWKMYGIAAVVLVAVGLSLFLLMQNQSRKTDVASNEFVQNEKSLDNASSKDSVEDSESSGNLSDKSSPSKSTTEALFKQYFEPDEIPEDEPGALQEGFSYFSNKQYLKTITTLESVDLDFVTRGEQSDKQLRLFYLHYYKGISYLALNKTSKAITVLDSALNESPDNGYRIKTNWYLALCFLQSGNSEKSEQLLISVKKNNIDTALASKAKSLSQQLKSLSAH